jgi:hypothetical protein
MLWTGNRDAADPEGLNLCEKGYPDFVSYFGKRSPSENISECMYRIKYAIF